MPRGNPNGMTAKSCISILRGERVLTKAMAKAAPILLGRLGMPTEDDGKLQRVLDALEYAEAAVFTFRKSGKSALKAAKALGFGAASPASSDDCDDEP